MSVYALLALSSSAVYAQVSSDSLQRAVPVLSGTATCLQDGLPFVARASSAPAELGRGPMVGTTRLGIFQPRVSDAAAARDPLAAMRAASLRHRGPGVALMLVGVAGVVTGLIIDESLITILGAGTGLVGLYLYLR
ncbi:MAG TPA: hypothetical protein VGQ69_07515 [Gemmatimonadales bacterium]|nr:hypothetical protein [Gemmatimonadales bacterium]